jgi:NAD(P)-dependent dehydrogenase (short-subunit alcohol dehydrogenase family)
MTFALPHLDTDLSGKVELVTGAAGALGSRFAATLASCGAAVALADVRTEQLHRVQSELDAAEARCMAVRLDLTAFDQLSDVVQQVESTLGAVDILVNNAGVNDAGRPHKMPPDLMSRVIATDLQGPFALSCEVATRMIAAERPGRIVNISSVAAYSYHDKTASPLYSITKAAVARMTEVLAVEWARFHINVNAIAPGLFWSEMTEGMVARIGDPSPTLPRGRIGYPAQLDSTLLYLVGTGSECVTGTVIKVDDGQKPR